MSLCFDIYENRLKKAAEKEKDVAISKKDACLGFSRGEGPGVAAYNRESDIRGAVSSCLFTRPVWTE